VQRACELSDRVVVSIFVNPTQFGAGEDLERYPRDPEGDAAKCREAGAALLFTPDAAAIYPDGYQSYVEVERLTKGLCGARRPGHFRGVCTVVAKLLNIVGPCVAVFGEKDYQQLQVVRRMVEDLAFAVRVEGAPIVREPDGLAASSRNAYLSEPDRAAATCLFRGLSAVREALAARGELSAEQARALVVGAVEAEPRARLEYAEVRHPRTLEPVARVRAGGAVVLVAARLGPTRLIDNIVL
jgi:pantoate--beta-alanine ligase